MATVCGRVERVNKLVSVRPLRSRCGNLITTTQLVHRILPGADMVVVALRYSAELGDVVVGRVTDVRPRLQGYLTSVRLYNLL